MAACRHKHSQAAFVCLILAVCVQPHISEVCQVWSSSVWTPQCEADSGLGSRSVLLTYVAVYRRRVRCSLKVSSFKKRKERHCEWKSLSLTSLDAPISYWPSGKTCRPLFSMTPGPLEWAVEPDRVTSASLDRLPFAVYIQEHPHTG